MSHCVLLSVCCKMHSRSYSTEASVESPWYYTSIKTVMCNCGKVINCVILKRFLWVIVAPPPRILIYKFKTPQYHPTSLEPTYHLPSPLLRWWWCPMPGTTNLRASGSVLVTTQITELAAPFWLLHKSQS